MQEGAISVSCDLRGFNKWAAFAVGRQVPFATAKALTQLAKAIQAEERAQLSRRFKIRSGWTSRGIQYRAADKRDYPNCSAEVGTRDEFMVQQETGGIKRPKYASGEHSGVPGGLAIPTLGGEKIAALRKTASGRIPKAKRPKALIKAKKAFAEGEEIRLRLPGDDKPKAPVAYFIRPQAKIRPRFGFRSTAEEVVSRTFGAVFTAALESALKPRGKK